MTTLPTRSLPTRSGMTIAVRPVDPADEPALAAFFAAVTDEDRRFRFFSAGRHVTHEQLVPLIEVDHWRSESWLAHDAATGELVGTALLAGDAAMDTAEVAVSVRADCRGQGIGWALLDFVADEAETRGFSRAIAIESRDNHAAIELEREKGFVPEAYDGDPSLVMLVKRLEP